MPQVAKLWYNNAFCSLFWATFSAHVATLQSVQTSQRGYLHFNVCSSYSEQAMRLFCITKIHFTEIYHNVFCSSYSPPTRAARKIQYEADRGEAEAKCFSQKPEEVGYN